MNIRDTKYLLPLHIDLKSVRIRMKPFIWIVCYSILFNTIFKFIFISCSLFFDKVITSKTQIEREMKSKEGRLR